VETLAQALHAHFEEVSRSELQRLRKKTASLNAAQREQVDAIAVQVVQAIAARASDALRADDGRRLAPVLARLFRI
jgi:glutamyl-tRNA reductase